MSSSKSATKPRKRTKSDADQSADVALRTSWKPKVVEQHSASGHYEQTLEEAFPDVEAGLKPFGSRVLVQLRQPRKKSKGGIIFHQDTQDTEKWNTTVGRVVALGPAAFRNRDTLELWPEGVWAKPGDFLWVPKYGGQRHEPKIPGTNERAHFIVLNDLDLIGEHTVDPREVMAFL